MRKLLLFFSLFISVTAFCSPDYYLTGEFNDWKPNLSQYKFTEKGDIYTITVGALPGEFKITTPGWEHQYGAGLALKPGQTYKCTESGNGYNMTVADPAARDITITFDDKNKTVSIAFRPALYLVGAFNNWQASPAYRFFESGDLYLLYAPAFTGAFKVVSEDNSISFGSANSAGIQSGVETALFNQGTSYNFAGVSNPASYIKITVNPNGTAADAGVSAMVPEEGSESVPEYFTLQGLRVTDPAPGIYIRRAGNKTEKIFIR